MKRFFRSASTLVDASNGAKTSAKISGKTTNKDCDVRLHINIPSYGCVFMNMQNEESTEWTDIRTTLASAVDDLVPTELNSSSMGRPLSGELEIHIAKGLGRRRCRGIRVTLKSESKLHLGPKRGWETDVLFERSVEQSGLITLDEGVSRFNFTIIVPQGLGPYDTHPNGSISLDLIAELVGMKKVKEGSRSNGHSTPVGGYATPVGGYATPVGGASTPPTPPEGTVISSPPNRGISSNMTVSWGQAVPDADELDRSLSAAGSSRKGSLNGSEEEDFKWIKNSITTKRHVTLLYNPEPENSVSRLNEHKSVADVGGLGVVELHYHSFPWTVCGPLEMTATLNPAPQAVVYYARVMLRQTSSIVSPRDDKNTEPLVNAVPFLLWETGVRPQKGTVPKKTEMLWRGEEADNGPDKSELILRGNSRLPDDRTARPTTMENLCTPIKVTHKLVFDVWYSVAGQDARGNPLRDPRRPLGEMRVLSLDLPVVLPSCAFIPEVVTLPSYDKIFNPEPCVVCGTPRDQQCCRACPPTTVPHARHDIPAEYGGDSNGVCVQCQKRFLTSDKDCTWMDCACGLSLNDLEARMATLNLQGQPDIMPTGTGDEWIASKMMLEERSRMGRGA